MGFGGCKSVMTNDSKIAVDLLRRFYQGDLAAPFILTDWLEEHPTVTESFFINAVSPASIGFLRQLRKGLSRTQTRSEYIWTALINHTFFSDFFQVGTLFDSLKKNLSPKFKVWALGQELIFKKDRRHFHDSGYCAFSFKDIGILSRNIVPPEHVQYSFKQLSEMTDLEFYKIVRSAWANYNRFSHLIQVPNHV